MVFFIGPEEGKRIAFVKETAENTPFTREELITMQGRTVEEIPLPDHTLFIPVNFRFFYTIEEQVLNGNKVWTRHLSGTDLGRECPPPLEVIRIVMDKLGFKSTLEKCRVFLADKDRIVNVL